MLLRRVGSLLMLSAVLASLNLHLALTQTAAWAGMLSDYGEQTGSFREAVEMTFGGDYPCELCGLVEQSIPVSDNESAPALEQAAKVLLLIPSDKVCFPLNLFSAKSYASPDEQGRFCFMSPETPPPRI
ncbi:hypothetical protein [Rubellicoccus peritrichatus]|uniref:DUF2946 domain-containing protein n=1 Tax=Rubellicoccus peritrichatus TaxID=3080537 RepID=A0AAQ3L5C9_9BACT|nr:hypothetical protein [Puniceicoccus sp. CR14]WOO39281.1 hypothetical protein RZN69_11715 [Puniceicoccus sp. CR14]